MASLFADADFRARVNVPESAEERKALIARWHKEKTAIYEGIINSERFRRRPGSGVCRKRHGKRDGN